MYWSSSDILKYRTLTNLYIYYGAPRKTGAEHFTQCAGLTSTPIDMSSMLLLDMKHPLNADEVHGQYANSTACHEPHAEGDNHKLGFRRASTKHGCTMHAGFKRGTQTGYHPEPQPCPQAGPARPRAVVDEPWPLEMRCDAHSHAQGQPVLPVISFSK